MNQHESRNRASQQYTNRLLMSLSCGILLVTSQGMLQRPTRTAPAKHFLKRSPFSFMSSRGNLITDERQPVWRPNRGSKIAHQGMDTLRGTSFTADWAWNKSDTVASKRIWIIFKCYLLQDDSRWESRISRIQYGAVVFNLIQWPKYSQPYAATNANERRNSGHTTSVGLDNSTFGIGYHCSRARHCHIGSFKP